MPFRDGTGPNGEGPRTGRGVGFRINKEKVATNSVVGGLFLSLFGLIKKYLSNHNSIIRTFIKNKMNNKALKEPKGNVSEGDNGVVDAEYNIISPEEDN